MKYRFADWIKAAGIRAVKTMAQTAVGMLTGEMVGIIEVNWLNVLSCAAGRSNLRSWMARWC